MNMSAISHSDWKHITALVRPAVVALVAIGSIAPATMAGTQLFYEGFETDGEGTRYTSSDPFYNDDDQYWMRTDHSNITVSDGTDPNSSYSNYEGDWFWAGEETWANGNIFEQELLFNNPASVAGYSDLELSGLFGTSGIEPSSNQTWYMQVWVAYDGGAFEKVLAFERALFTGSPSHDTDLDGEGDGADLGTELQLFSVPLQSANTIEIKVLGAANSTGRAIAFDAIQVTGAIPSPGALALLGLAGACHRRRRRQN